MFPKRANNRDMEVSRAATRRSWSEEGGFTLIEVLLVMILMGIVFAIASSMWFSAVESREVDSATNQVVGDLRLAHSTATNRLTAQQVAFTADSSEYSMTGSPSPRDLDDDSGSNTIIADTTVTIVFCSNGRASATTPNCSSNIDPPITFKIKSADGDTYHDIQVMPATSRVKID
jgi:prepilin-type N-terminal cleavage/methylation domain-containing protein